MIDSAIPHFARPSVCARLEVCERKLHVPFRYGARPAVRTPYQPIQSESSTRLLAKHSHAHVLGAVLRDVACEEVLESDAFLKDEAHVLLH